MNGRRASRWLALGGLVLAFGCRSAPQSPIVTTPLFPDAIIPGPPPTPTVPSSSSVIPHAVSSAPILPPGAKLPAAQAFQPRELPSESLRLPDSLVDFKSSLPSERSPGELRLPDVKPLMVAPPGPPAGPDGFAPAPIIPLPEDPKVVAGPTIVNQPEPPTLPVKADEQFGHASDYRWLAGTLDYHAKARYWTLRYADLGSDDEWGGKVRLMDDDRLRDYRTGDIVYLEGDLLAPRAAAQFEASGYPPYRISAIRKR